MYSLLPSIVLLMFAMAGCATAPNVAGTWFDTDSTLHTVAAQQPTSGERKPTIKYAALLRVNNYSDQREQRNPRLLGANTERVRGVSGNQLLIDQDVSDLVTSAIAQKFEAAGYRVVGDASVGGNALDAPMFEVSGAIKDLTLNVKFRDDISIAIETTVKDLRSGDIVWTGLVTEKNDRFAGVSGNNKDDVVDYLIKELRVVSDKTVAAISATLMANNPASFNLTPGTQAIPGVLVYTAPVANEPVSLPPKSGARSSGVAQPITDVGELLLSTTPPRAKVYLNGIYYGLTPLRVAIESGIHALTVKQQGYQTVSEKISVRTGESTEMELSLER